MRSERSGYAFGTFKGVFTPSILTILGVIMYLRFGWVLGQVGLARTLVIVVFSCGITFLTGLSLGALATNMRVSGGGAYFLISRSFGMETGAAIGVPLYLAQAIGIAFYTAGFSEAVVIVFPALDPQTVAVATLCVLTLITWFSADLALRTQFFILAVILGSLVSFILGGSVPPEAAPAVVAVERFPFWAVFAVFFPAVTGIEAGLAMSGDLRDPSRSLPRGTLLACAVGFLVYLAIPIVLSMRVPDADRLIREPLIMRDVARWGALIVAGIWGASLSSAVGALLGAPRTLQALGKDGVAPRFLARGYGKGNDPRIATALSFSIALAGVLAGGINVIAPVLSMFFLTSYACLNLAAALETLLGGAHWRPTFRVHWSVGVVGFLACAGAMLMIDAGAAILALISCGLIFGFMKRRVARARWGDVRRAFWGWAAQKALMRLDQLPVDERSWRPNLLVFSGIPSARWYLIEIADAIARGRGLMTTALILPASIPPERRSSVRLTVRDYVARREVTTFVKVMTSEDFVAGARALVDGYGFGPLKPNTILLGDSARAQDVEAYVGFLCRLQRQRRNLIILRADDETASDDSGYIDLWWEGKGPNSWFMLAVAYLLSLAPDWRDSPLRLNTVVRAGDDQDAARQRLDGRIREARVEAEARVLTLEGADVFSVVREASRGSRLCLLGLRPCEVEESAVAYARYYETLMQRSAGLPPTAFVLASEQMDFNRIFL